MGRVVLSQWSTVVVQMAPTTRAATTTIASETISRTSIARVWMLGLSVRSSSASAPAPLWTALLAERPDPLAEVLRPEAGPPELDQLLLLLRRQARVGVERLDRALVPPGAERRALGDLGGQRERLLRQALVRHGVVDEPDRHRPWRAEVAAGEEELLRPRVADDVDELLQSRVA